MIYSSFKGHTDKKMLEYNVEIKHWSNCVGQICGVLIDCIVLSIQGQLESGMYHFFL